LAATVVLLLPAPAVLAHPVPANNHDRTVVVRLSWNDKQSRFDVHVEYRLEVDELTAINEYLDLSEEVDFARAKQNPDGIYQEYTRLFAPILAGNVAAKANGKLLEFKCVKRAHRLKDENGQLLGHLRCDFLFQAHFPAAAAPTQNLEVKEQNFELTWGKIGVSIVGDPSLRILGKTEADQALKNRPERKREPGEEDKLRTASATFQRTSLAADPEPELTAPANPQEPSSALLRLFLGATGNWFWLLLLAAAGFGAAHALTPGHGKTLVAAYLVGERGTSLHALILGLVTTLTHTGVVLLIAVGLRFASREIQLQVAAGLGLTMGMLIIGLGAWRLLCNLAGRADHVHLGGKGHHHHHGHGHHHHHGHADHDHDEHGNIIIKKAPVGWWGLLVLGMSGGIVPCWDAVAMLILAVGMGQLDLALPLLLAFSAGLAAVLVLVGVLVVHVRGFATSRWGEGRLVRSLPVLSALALTVLGFWLCYESVHPS
jgi:ABC-type nickel/cobalt efflux system permease component RcnA